MSILSSPTLAKFQSWVECQSTSYETIEHRKACSRRDFTYTDYGSMAAEDCRRFNMSLRLRVRVDIPEGKRVSK